VVRKLDIRPHCRRTRTVQSYSPGCGNVHLNLVHPIGIRTAVLHPLNRFEYIDRRTCPGVSWSGPFSPSNLSHHVWLSGRPSNTWFLGPKPSPHPNGNSISLAVFCMTHGRNDRQTDRQIGRPRSICSNRPHLASAAMWPNNSRLLQMRTTTGILLQHQHYKSTPRYRPAWRHPKLGLRDDLTQWRTQDFILGV